MSQITEQKKDLTQDQLEQVLAGQFSKTQDWQLLLYMLVMVVLFSLLFMWGFADVNFWIRLPVYVVLGITLLKCEQWVVTRRVRKTIEAIRAM